jgi:acyl-CoA dehydrogenase
MISKTFIETEAMRVMARRVAEPMDVMDDQKARVWLSAVKEIVPIRVSHVVGRAELRATGMTGRLAVVKQTAAGRGGQFSS